MAILETRNLKAGYGNGVVIRDIRFSLEKGEFVSVLGPNGSGKTTLIRALQGLLKDSSGEIFIDGENLFHLKRREISREIAFVPQIPDFGFEFTVRELVSMGRYIHQRRLSGLSPADSKIIDRVMFLTQIAHLQEKKVAHLSGGERQRVFIARALAQETSLLFLDEPSCHLDLNFSLEIYQILERLQKEQKKTIFCTEHNINLVIPYSQKIIFLKDGKIWAQGTPRDMITRKNILTVFSAEVDIRENRHSLLPEVSLIPRSTEELKEQS